MIFALEAASKFLNCIVSPLFIGNNKPSVSFNALPLAANSMPFISICAPNAPGTSRTTLSHPSCVEVTVYGNACEPSSMGVLLV